MNTTVGGMFTAAAAPVAECSAMPISDSVPLAWDPPTSWLLAFLPSLWLLGCLPACPSVTTPQGNASEAMALYLQLSKLGPAAGTTSSAALAKLARAAAAAGDAHAIQLLQKQLPGEAAGAAGRVASELAQHPHISILQRFQQSSFQFCILQTSCALLKL